MPFIPPTPAKPVVFYLLLSMHVKNIFFALSQSREDITIQLYLMYVLLKSACPEIPPLGYPDFNDGQTTALFNLNYSHCVLNICALPLKSCYS